MTGKITVLCPRWNRWTHTDIKYHSTYLQKKNADTLKLKKIINLLLVQLAYVYYIAINKYHEDLGNKHLLRIVAMF